ncbi:MAG: hypothetical protein RLP15_13545, partial [Cryomorphaceae bacterium]
MNTISYYIPHPEAKESTLTARTYINGEKFVTSTSIKIEPKNWNQKKQIVDFKDLPLSARMVKSKEINDQLSSFKTDLILCYETLLKTNKKPSKNDFRRAWKHWDNQKDGQSLVNFFINDYSVN